MSNAAKAFTGRPIQFENICQIFPPTVDQILDTPGFFTQMGVLIVKEEDLWDEYNLAQEEKDPQHKWKLPEERPTPFMLLLLQYMGSPEFRETITDAFRTFTKEEILIIPNLPYIIILNEEVQTALKTGSLDSLNEHSFKIINEDNYHEFQNCIRMATGIDPVERPNRNKHPRILRMEALARIRDKKKKKNSADMKTTLSAVCCMGIGITPLNIGELTYASLNNLTEMYLQKETFEQQSTSASMGMLDMSKHEFKHWISNPNED